MGRRSNKKKNTSTGKGINTTTTITTITSSSPHYPLFHPTSRCSSTDISSSSSNNDNDWLVFEILNRLPVKSLARFKSLSKRWCYLIERDQQFIDLHFTRSKTRLPSRLLIVVPLPHTQIQEETLERIQGNCYLDLWPYKEFHLTADLLFEEDDTKLKLVVDTVREIDSESYDVISKPVNGLVCLIDSLMNSVVCIRNISTGETSPWFQSSSIVMGEERHSFPNFYAFSFDPATNEHKLVCVLTVCSRPLYAKSLVCGVLTVVRQSNNNRWRRITEIPPYFLNDDYVHVNGVIYWSNRSLNDWGRIPRRPICLVAFDVGSEKFRTITIPDSILDRPRVLGDHLSFKDIIQFFEVDGYLSMVVMLNNCTFNMYIYEDDCYVDEDEKFSGTSTTSSLKNGRWTEVGCITLPFYMMNSHNGVKFHTFIGSDDKILVTSSTLGMEKKERLSIYCYNWKKGTWTEVDVSGIPFSVPQLSRHCFSTTFSESLLPLDNQSAL